MTGTDRTDWERIARQTLWQSLVRLGEDASRTTEEVADALYWGNDLDPEQVERMRRAAFDLRYVTEEYLARLCVGTDPWDDADDARTPSWHPTEGPMPDDSEGPDDSEDSDGPDDSDDSEDSDTN